MNNEDLQKLKEVALAATPGRWEYREADGMAAIASPTGWVMDDLSEQTLRDIEYCAAANPTAILALIAEVEQARAANGWMPIETAPKDGQYVLTCGRKYQSEHEDFWYESAFYRGDSGLFDYLDGEDVEHYQPSHWMPSPMPPQ